MGYLPEKFLFFLPLQTGGVVLGATALFASIVGLCGGVPKFEEILAIFGFNIFSVRSISGM